QYQLSLGLFREFGDDAGEAMIVFRLGSIATKLGEQERARRLTEEALDRFELIGHKAGECMALGSLGLIEVGDRHAPRARELYERSAALAHEIGFHWYEAVILGFLSDLLLSRGDLQLGETRSLAALALHHRIGARGNSMFRIAAIAWAAAERGEFERAGKFWGAIEAEQAREPIPGWDDLRARYEQRVVNRANAGFERGREGGEKLSLNEAVEEALSGT